MKGPAFAGPFWDCHWALAGQNVDREIRRVFIQLKMDERFIWAAKNIDLSGAALAKVPWH
ncbi:MAG: hypothetical protein ACI9ND_003002 [Yoonia sp.]